MNNNALLKKQGYVHIPQVLTPEEVQNARKTLTNIFSKESPYKGDINKDPNLGNIFVDAFTRYEDLRWVLFHPKVISALRSTLGDDFIFLPETGIHDSGFGNWHKDTSSQESRGHMFQWEEDFLMVQVGIYMQDNTPEYGGGLDVIPYSHTKRDRYANKVNPTVGERLRNKLFRMKLASNPYKEYTVPSKAGDMVIFNLRLDHKATHPTVRPIPEEHRKFAIFMVCSVNNKHARTYTEYIKSRPDYYYLENHKYPADLLQEAKKHSLNLMEA